MKNYFAIYNSAWQTEGLAQAFLNGVRGAVPGADLQTCRHWRRALAQPEYKSARAACCLIVERLDARLHGGDLVGMIGGEAILLAWVFSQIV